MQKVYHCSNPTAQYVKSQFYCTAQLNVLHTLKPLFPFPIPIPVSSHHLKYHIRVSSKYQNIRQQYVIATQILNTVINLKSTTGEWFIRIVLFMRDVQTVAMKLLLITDRTAAVTAVVLTVTDCTHRAHRIYFVHIFCNSAVVVVIVVVVVVVVAQQLQQ